MSKIWKDAGELIDAITNSEIMNENKKIYRKVKNKNEYDEVIKEEKSITRRKGKAIRCYNVITNEILQFESAWQANEYLRYCDTYVCHLARTKKTTKDGWKVEYIKEV